MTATKKAASPKKGGAAARSERNGKPKAATYRGIELELPPKLGWRALKAYGDLEAAEGAASIERAFALAERLLGPEQAEAVYEKFDQEDLQSDDVGQALRDLFNVVFEVYGTDAGESSASTAS